MVSPTHSTQRALLRLVLLNLLIALAITAPLITGGGLSTYLQIAFALTSLIGWLGMFLFLLGGALALAARWEPVRRWSGWIAAVLFTLLQAALFLDVRIYGMFRFHFNKLVWQTITAPGGWASLHVPLADLVALGVLVLLVVLGQRALFRLLERRDRPAAARLTWARVAIALAAFGLADRATFAAFDLMRNYEVARAARVVPGYQRVTIRRFAQTWFGWEPGASDVSFRGARASTGLRYPGAPLRYRTPERRPNVLWVVLESWRHDAFGAEHSPRIHAISRRAHRFENHLSGGNNTTFGVFTMFYGLYGSYRSSFLAEQRGPVLIDRLRELDYRFAVYSSFPMTWPEFRKYIFVDIAGAVKDAWPNDVSAKNDPLVVDELLSFVDRDRDRPFFGFLLLDSSHAPYTFPETHAKFRPYTEDAKLVRYIDVTQRAPEMRNRYFNAVLWEDTQVGRLWDELERRGLLENTIVLITGDHGEEFNEHGFWTHSGGYTPEQIHVPLILWWPGLEPRTVSRRTGHEDIVPTFLEALGVENPPRDYSLGHSLFDPAENAYVVSCGWRDCAVADDRGYVVFGTESHYSMNFDVLDPGYRSVADPRAVMSSRAEQMMTVMQEMGVFLK